MVIKGGSRSGAGDLAAHLLRTDTNERAEVIDLKGVAAHRLPEALREMEAVALGTRCRKALYHASINTGPGEELTLEQKAAAVARLELALGLEGHARAVVEHRKEGRDHLHVVWSRIDVDTMRTTHDGHNYRKHEAVSRELEREFSHNRVQGAHIERDGPAGERQPRPPRTSSPGDVQQATRTKRELGDVKAEITRLWQAADTGPAFAAAVDAAGYVLAQGDRRGYCIVDQAGGVHSLARRIEGANTKDVNARLAGIELASLPTADQARAVQRDRQAVRDHARDPQADIRASEPPLPAPEMARRGAEHAPAPEAPSRTPERAQPPPERRDGPDYQQQLADSAEYRRERAENTRANDNRAARPPAAPAAKEAGRAIGRAGGLLGTGIGKAAGGLLGLLGGLLGSAGAATDNATRSPPAARPEGERAAPPAPPRAPAPQAAPVKAPAPRPPSLMDEIERELQAQKAAGGRAAPKPERDRDDGRSRFEGRPSIRLAAIVSGGDIGWVLTAKRRLIAYSERTGDYIAEQLRELDAIMFRALHGPA